MEIPQTPPAARRAADLDADELLTMVFKPPAVHAKDHLEQAEEAGEGCLECIYNRICEWVQSIIDCLRPLFAGVAAVQVDHTKEIALVKEFVGLHCDRQIPQEELP